MVVDPPVVLDRGSAAPLAVQITGQLRAAVAASRLRAGERLPSSRALASSLGVSRTVVTNAYQQLFAEGWLEGRHGSGTYVAQGAAADDPAVLRSPAPPPSASALPAPSASGPPVPSASVLSGSALPPPFASGPPVPSASVLSASALRASVPFAVPAASASALPAPSASGPSASGPSASGPSALALTDLRPGVPWVAGLDQAAWRRSWRRAGEAAPSRWPDPRGLLALRIALCGYLRRSRGLGCTPDNIMITRGVASGLSLLATALLQPRDRAGIEEPGYPVGRAILAASGAQVVPCRVDSHGLVVRDLPAGLRLVYVTPAHQYPLGGRLPVPRRQRLVAWARCAGALVVEDDYDSEFRYDVAPLPALYGLDPDVVAYLGTTSKMLTPVLGVGWLVARQDLVTALAVARESLGDRTGEQAQHALLTMIETGDLDRHIRRMRREYARRRDAIVSILGDPAVPARLLGDTAGLHVVLELDRGSEDVVVAAARERGVAVYTLRRYFAAEATALGLVLGYGGVSLDQVVAAASVLREILVGGAVK